MVRIVEVALISAVTLIVLAWGGTEPLTRATVQVLLLGLGILLIASYGTAGLGQPRFPRAVLLFLLALVLLQIIPLPVWLIEPVRGPVALPSGISYATVSIAPHQTLSHLLLWLTYGIVFYGTTVVCQNHSGKRRLVLALLVLGAVEAFYGLVQFLTGWQPLGSYVREGLKPVGTYINSNHFAGLLEMILPFALGLAIYHFEAIRRVRFDPRRCRRIPTIGTDGEKFAFWLFVAVLMFVAIVVTQSRMGIVSALASLLVITILLTRARRAALAPMGLLVVFLLAGILLMVWIGGVGPVLVQFEALDSEYALGDQGRWAIWQDTLRLIEQTPWMGTGLGTFALAYRGVQTAYLTRVVEHAHNDYVEIVSEVGLLGGLVLFGSFFFVLGRAVRCYRMGEDRLDRALALGCVGSLVALLVHSLADFNLQMPANALVFSMVLGLAYAIAKESRRVVPSGV